MLTPARFRVSRRATAPRALEGVEALPKPRAGRGRQESAPPFEVVLADGGSRDGTVSRFGELTRDWPSRGRTARVVACPRPGRAEQKNAGARAAAGEVLVFLHADTHLPPGATLAVLRALADPTVVGGGFRHSYSEPGVLLRIISSWATARSLLLGTHYGDQAIFARRSVFEAIGGVPGEPLFEDLELSRRLRARGRVVTLPLAVSTSARRLRRGGVARTAARFAWFKLRHALGVRSSRLKARYPDVR